MSRERPADRAKWPLWTLRCRHSWAYQGHLRTHTFDRGSCTTNMCVCVRVLQGNCWDTQTHTHKGNWTPGQCAAVCALLMTTCLCVGSNKFTASAQVCSGFGRPALSSFRCLHQRKRKRCRKIFNIFCPTADLSGIYFKVATLQERKNRENYCVFQDFCLFALEQKFPAVFFF